jgi:hypothetical protein
MSGTHTKEVHAIAVGGTLVCGSRKLRLDALDGDVAEITLTVKKGESVEVRDARTPDPVRWIREDPGEGDTTDKQEFVTIGHKIRLGSYRQFRFLHGENGGLNIVVVSPLADSPSAIV